MVCIHVVMTTCRFVVTTCRLVVTIRRLVVTTYGHKNNSTMSYHAKRCFVVLGMVCDDKSICCVKKSTCCVN